MAAQNCDVLLIRVVIDSVEATEETRVINEMRTRGVEVVFLHFKEHIHFPEVLQCTGTKIA